MFEQGNPLVTCVNQAPSALKSSGRLQDIQDLWLAGGEEPDIQD